MSDGWFSYNRIARTVVSFSTFKATSVTVTPILFVQIEKERLARQERKVTCIRDDNTHETNSLRMRGGLTPIAGGQ